eukprot:695246-Hanusia_phi.AAC.1
MGPLTVSPGFWRAVLFVSCLFYKGYAEAFLLAPQSSVSGMNAQVSASCKSQHLHVAASSLRQSRSAMNHHGFGVSMGAMEVYVEPILDKRYVRFLSELSCESFYGQQSPLSVLNPIANLQRGLVLREIERDIETRISRYMEQPRCGRLLVAVDVQGLLVGFVDVSRTLYSKEDKDFKLALGPGLSLMDPADQFERRLYIANLAVSQKCRRRGVARQLMKAAHEVALELGKEEESVWLEVRPLCPGVGNVDPIKRHDARLMLFPGEQE